MGYILINITTGNRVRHMSGELSNHHQYPAQAEAEWKKYFGASPFITIHKVGK